MRRHLTLILPLLLTACATGRSSEAPLSPHVQGPAGGEIHLAGGHAGDECEDGVCPLPEDMSGTAASPDSWVVSDMDGRELDLGAALDAGRPVAFVFWQTWCASCREEFPELVAAQREHGDSIEFVGVISGPNDMVDDDAVRGVVRQYGLNYAQVRDRDLALTKRYRVTGTPTIVVVGPDRRTAYRGHASPADWAALAR